MAGTHSQLIGLDLHSPSYEYAINETGSTISKMKAIKFIEITNGYPKIALGNPATGIIRGITIADILNNGVSQVCQCGLLTNVDTTSWGLGDYLYSDSAGNLSTTINGGPLAQVLKVSSTIGILYVDVFANAYGSTGGIGISNLNGLSASNQIFNIGTSGISPNWSSAIANHVLNIPMSSIAGVTAGLLSNVDWNTFNNKQNPITPGSMSETSSSILTITNGSSVTVGPNVTIEVTKSDNTHDGYLSSANWNTFNNKLTSPMDTLGDIIYGASSGTATKLAGNITTDKKFLNQTGTGIASAAPQWDNIAMLDVSVSTLGSPVYKNLYNVFNIMGSAGIISGGVISIVDATHVAITSGSGMVKSTNVTIDDLMFFDWLANNNLLITTNEINYVYVDYNSGSPIINRTNDYTLINRNTQFLIAGVWGDGVENPHIINVGLNINNWLSKESLRLEEARRGERVSGLLVSETGTRNIGYTAGLAYVAGIRKTYASKDTSGTDTFTYIYRDGIGGWIEQFSQTQISNLLYDNNTGTLATLVNGQYGVHWVFLLADGAIYVLYGQASYNLTNAQNATIPVSLPPELTDFGILAAKIIVLKNAASLYSVSSAYTTMFPVNSPSDHNDLGGLQGGTVNEYYHLLSAAYTNITSVTPTYEGYIATKAGTVKTKTNFLTITNSGNAADMDGTQSAILFRQYYYHLTTPAVVDLGALIFETETDWTSTAGTQDGVFKLRTVTDGSLTASHDRIYVNSTTTRFPNIYAFSFGGTTSSSFPYSDCHFYPYGRSGAKTYTNGAPAGLGLNFYYDTAVANYGYVDIVAGATSTASVGGSCLRIFTQPKSTGAPVQAIKISETQNIAIGIHTPASKMHQDEGDAVATYYKFTAGTTTGQTALDGFDVGVDGSGNAILKQFENLDMDFYTNNTKQMGISAAGVTTVETLAINNAIQASVGTASTHKITITVGGNTYYLLATNV